MHPTRAATRPERNAHLSHPSGDGRTAAALLLALLASGCLYVRPGDDDALSGTYLQGLLGLAEIEPDATLDPATGISTRAGDSVSPSLGGAGQYLFGDRAGLGLEGGFTFQVEDDTTRVATAGGLVVADEDTTLVDLFFGALLQLPLGDGRLYAGAGALAQYADVHLEYADGGALFLLDDSAFGGGTYARVGIEVPVGPRLVGIGVRWLDSQLDPSGPGPDLDLDQVQYTVTVTDWW